MPSLHVQVELYGNASLPQGCVIHERVLYRIYRVILRLEQEGGRRPASDANVGVQREASFGHCQMPWIESDREIGAATRRVGRVHSRVQTLLEMRADRGDHMPASRKAEHSDLVRVD